MLFSWKRDEKAEENSVLLVDWNAMISAIAKETAHRAGSMVPDSMYFKLVSENPDPMHKIKLIQHLAPAPYASKRLLAAECLIRTASWTFSTGNKSRERSSLAIIHFPWDFLGTLVVNR